MLASDRVSRVSTIKRDWRGSEGDGGKARVAEGCEKRRKVKRQSVEVREGKSHE